MGRSEKWELPIAMFDFPKGIRNALTTQIWADGKIIPNFKAEKPDDDTPVDQFT